MHVGAKIAFELLVEIERGEVVKTNAQGLFSKLRCILRYISHYNLVTKQYRMVVLVRAF